MCDHVTEKLCKFAQCSSMELSEDLIQMVEHKLSRQQWWQYAIEVEAIMQLDMDAHLPFLPSNMDMAKCVLMLRASKEEKALALSFVI